MKNPIRHQDYLRKHLANAVEAAAYLNAVAEDNHIQLLLKAIRHVVEAQGGIGVLARKTGLGRTQLYKTLSSDGNPEMKTLSAILGVYGIRIAFIAEEKRQRAA